MLSRVADTLYWMSRFVERAEGVTRLVEVYRDSDLEVDARLGTPPTGNPRYWPFALRNNLTRTNWKNPPPSFFSRVNGVTPF